MGYPTGGSNMCVTQGVVSRVGMTPYAHTGTSLLAVQIDAAINPGNSGGEPLCMSVSVPVFTVRVVVAAGEVTAWG